MKTQKNFAKNDAFLRFRRRTEKRMTKMEAQVKELAETIKKTRLQHERETDMLCQKLNAARQALRDVRDAAAEGHKQDAVAIANNALEALNKKGIQ